MVNELNRGQPPGPTPGAEPPAGLGPAGTQPPVPPASPGPPASPVPPPRPDSGRVVVVGGMVVVVLGLLVALGVVAWKAGWLDGLVPFRQSSAPIETSIEPTSTSGDLLPAETFRWISGDSVSVVDRSQTAIFPR